MLDLKQCRRSNFNILSKQALFFPFGRVMHRMKRDNFTSTLNDLKGAKQWYFAFSSKVTLTISFIKRNLWILKASALLKQILSLLALVIAAIQTKGL